MTSAKINRIVADAERSCAEAGVRLTTKRKAVLLTLLNRKQALSAYELAEQYRLDHGESIPVMSVYRMLDFLAEQDLVHKLSAINKYVACAHISCAHAHEPPQFLICDGCQRVSEVGVEPETMASLGREIEATGFHLSGKQLELHGLCGDCFKSADNK
ncbi:Fur family transcriptional regulator [Kineobactrum salinum]|uniref:Transcriptional repressor n=1 Tax=Kineobactrum salinum TaxID=2708301 RepID=A0A6C0U5L5_9GAMM|nr:transcriptional repressor [Kineobactrum salinum]QIB66709.1 transcriptional repressor [Kineobactrum salinum]